MFKKIVRNLDRIFLRHKLTEWRTNQLEKKLARFLESKLGNSFTAHYAKSKTSELYTLCEFYGSDKGGSDKTEKPFSWAPHNYTEYYSILFDHCRESISKVFECGIGTNDPNLDSTMGENGKPGASLKVWRDYFPNAEIFGVDVDRNILFSDNRIKTFYLDQLDVKSIEKCWKEISEDKFDLMIDDGLHTFEAGTNLFMHSKDRLSERGIYVIEDVYGDLMDKYQQFFSQLPYSTQFVVFSSPTRSSFSEGLVVIRKLSV